MERRRLRVWTWHKPSGAVWFAVMAALFIIGAAAGFLLDCRWPMAELPSEFALSADTPVTPVLTIATFWSHFRWLLLAVLLGFSGSGAWLLPAVLFLRGALFGYSYAALFVSQPGAALFLHYLPTALFDCAPLLLLTVLGLLRLTDGIPSEAARVTRFSTLFILSAFCAIFYCFIELWLLSLASL